MNDINVNANTNPFCMEATVAQTKSKMDLLERESPQSKARTDLRDNSGRLIARLASAQTQFDVRWVIAEGSNELLSLNIASAGNCDTAKLAQIYADKIRGLLRKADRKLSDLVKEEKIIHEKAVEIRKKQEEQLKQNKERAKEHEAKIRKLGNELYGRRSERRNREGRWLLSAGEPMPPAPMPLMPISMPVPTVAGVASVSMPNMASIPDVSIDIIT